ncbi:MAG TPA: hypothetical protein VMT29_09400 [Steroidobacteraceae bacterium]|nr:hypothetical protein [Steroidobacteraceae bacterium]
MLSFPTFETARRLVRIREAAVALLTLGLLCVSHGAQAGCDSRAFGAFNVKLPAWMKQGGPGSASIVGLWHTSYTSTSGPLPDYQSFDVWHGDGTEFESADIPPVVGALCVGIFTQRGRTVTLNHFGWTWDITGTNPTGSFNLEETLTVSADGKTYSGSYDFRPYDMLGNFEPGGETKGTVTATRITMSTHAAD